MGLQRATRPAAAERELRVKYYTSEEFLNTWVMSLKDGSLAAFRRRVRSLDVLLVDDVQVLAHKERTQEEFLHTFNALVDCGKQVVLASDAPPRSLRDLSRSLVTRFLSGLVVGLKRPDLETRLGILESQAPRLRTQFSRPVLRLLAESMRGDARELVGALMQLDLRAQLAGGRLDLDDARACVAEMLVGMRGSGAGRTVTMAVVRSHVATHYGLSVESLNGRSRGRQIVHARQVACYLGRKLTGKSLADIGAQLGGRSHSTVRAAEAKVNTLVEQDPHFRAELDEIVDAVEADRDR